MVVAGAAVNTVAGKRRNRRIAKTDSISLAISSVDELFEPWDEDGAVMVGYLEKRGVRCALFVSLSSNGMCSR